MDHATAGINRAPHNRFGVTGAQAAIPRLVTEWAAPSPGGQLNDRLAERGPGERGATRSHQPGGHWERAATGQCDASPALRATATTPARTALVVGTDY